MNLEHHEPIGLLVLLSFIQYLANKGWQCFLPYDDDVVPQHLAFVFALRFCSIDIYLPFSLMRKARYYFFPEKSVHFPLAMTMSRRRTCCKPDKVAASGKNSKKSRLFLWRSIVKTVKNADASPDKRPQA